MALILALIGAAVVGVIGFGVTWLVAGRDPGIGAAEPDGAAVPLPTSRPLVESDIQRIRFDTTMRGYRMGQVDAALRRAAYDIGYKDELINVLEAEVQALRDGRLDDAETLRQARTASAEAKPAGPKPSVAPAADRAQSAQPETDDRPESTGARGHEESEDSAGPDREADEIGTPSVNSANGVK